MEFLFLINCFVYLSFLIKFFIITKNLLFKIYYSNFYYFYYFALS